MKIKLQFLLLLLLFIIFALACFSSDSIQVFSDSVRSIELPEVQH